MSCKCEKFGTDLAGERFPQAPLKHWSKHGASLSACMVSARFAIFYVQNMDKIDYCCTLFISRDGIGSIYLPCEGTGNDLHLANRKHKCSHARHAITGKCKLHVERPIKCIADSKDISLTCFRTVDTTWGGPTYVVQVTRGICVVWTFHLYRWHPLINT